MQNHGTGEQINQLISFQLNGGSVLSSHELVAALPADDTDVKLVLWLPKPELEENEKDEDTVLCPPAALDDSGPMLD